MKQPRHWGRFWFGLGMLTGIILVLDTAQQSTPSTLLDITVSLLGSAIVFGFLFISTGEEW